MANRNIRKTPIDSQLLLKAIKDAGYSIRSLAKIVSRGERTIRYYLEQGVMPDVLLDDICHFVNYGRPAEYNDWEKVWIAPSDGTFKGRCRECGFTHFFIEGHCLQYRYCPQCGSKKFKEVPNRTVSAIVVDDSPFEHVMSVREYNESLKK